MSRQSSDDSSLPAGFGAVNWIERRVAPFAERFGNAPAVRALREALPISFIGLLVGLVIIVAFVEHGSFVDRLRASIPGAFAVMSILLVFVLSTRLAIRLHYLIAPTIGGSILAFAFALPREAMRSPAPPAPEGAPHVRCDLHCIGDAASREFTNLSAVLGTSGLFTAIVACLLTIGVIGLMRRRFPGDKGVVLGALAVWIGSYGLYALHLSIGGALAAIVSPLGDLGDSFTALFIITGVESLLWLFGIHGPALLAALVLPVYLNLQFANTAAYAHRDPLHFVTVSTFLYVFPGGCGATLPLIVLLLRSRVPRLRTFARATILPSLINTNEPVMFGLPLVYNPILGIPYLLAPLAITATTYGAMALGWVRAPVYYMPSTVPVFVNTFLATLDWRSIPLVAVNLAIAGAIYLPFVRVYERMELAKQL